MVIEKMTSASTFKPAEALSLVGDFAVALIRMEYLPCISEVESGSILLSGASLLLKIGFHIEVECSTCVCMA